MSCNPTAIRAHAGGSEPRSLYACPVPVRLTPRKPAGKPAGKTKPGLAKPVKAMEPAKAVKLAAEPVTAVKRAAEPVRAEEPTQPAKPAKAVKPVKAVKAVKLTKRTEPTKLAKPVKAVKPAKPVKAVKPTKRTEPTKLAKPVKPVKAVKAVEPAKARPSTRPTAPAIMRPTKKPTKKTPPNLKVEQSLWADGHEIIVGIDEVGRGSWAGPLSIGAVVLPKTGRVNGVRDSKMLSEREREALFDRVAGGAQHWAVGSVSHDECDRIGMSAAQKLAAQRAIEGLGLGFDKIDRVLIDGNWDFVSEFLGEGKTQRIIKGDATCLTIASASVLAKVSRDRLMRAYDPEFPGFNFAENKGYPCPKHKMALQAYGPTSIHRRSWVFMDHLPWTGVPRIPPAHLAAGVSVDQEVLF